MEVTNPLPPNGLSCQLPPQDTKSKMNVKTNQINKRIVWDFWQSLENTDADKLRKAVGSVMRDDVCWRGPDPINQLQGIEAYVSSFWLPLLHSFPDLTRQSHIFFGGKSNGRRDGDISLDGRYWVTGTGYFNATFAYDYLTIPATGSKVNIRWGEFCCLEDGKIVDIYFLLDFIDLFQQAGFNVLPPSRGADGVYPPPEANDGILLDEQSKAESTAGLKHIRHFIFDGLNSFDQRDLSSMGMADFFHPQIKWYGPGGIGACMNFKEFENFHQQPWLSAYPDRQVQDLDALIAEGSYSGGPGWAGVLATHTGDYLDCPATGRSIEFNGLDWWKREGELYIENWVFVDMIHLFRQFGIDLFYRLGQQIKQR